MSDKLANVFLILVLLIPLSCAVCTETEYQCEAVVGDPEICIDFKWMCDGYSDCPNEEDEVHDICGIPCAQSRVTATAGTTGTINCGDTVTGTSLAYQDMTFAFTFPTTYSQLKITTCHTENEGSASLEMYNSDYSSYIVGSSDYECDCNDRPVIIASTSSDLVSGGDYIVNIIPFFVGKYFFTVECGNIPFSGGDSCTETIPCTPGGIYSPYSTLTGTSTYSPCSQTTETMTEEPTQPTSAPAAFICDPTMSPTHPTITPSVSPTQSQSVTPTESQSVSQSGHSGETTNQSGDVYHDDSAFRFNNNYILYALSVVIFLYTLSV